MDYQLYVIRVTCKSTGSIHLHAGGRGNGAQGGLYTKKQINRIIGKYPEGSAEAVPVAPGYTFDEAIDNDTEADLLEHLRECGLEQWPGYEAAMASWIEEGETE